MTKDIDEPDAQFCRSSVRESKMSMMIGHCRTTEAITLPPHQQLAAAGKWPVVGERVPRRSDEPWRVSVIGLVVRPQTWTLAELRALPAVERAIDVHCVTRWS